MIAFAGCCYSITELGRQRFGQFVAIIDYSSAICLYCKFAESDRADLVDYSSNNAADPGN